MIRRGIGVQGFVSAGGAGTDADAQAVITAIESTGVTLTATQKTACNTLVTDLKGYGIWTKMKAVYGFLGGTAGAHKWNWKNPADTNAAFRLVFSGGWTHSANGALPNGTNAYANTFLAPSSQLSLNSASISYYSRTSGFSTTLMGSSSASNNVILLAPRWASGVLDDYSAINCATFQKSAASNTLGLFTASRIASTNYKGFQNGVEYFNSVNNSNSLSTQNIFIGARNLSGSADQYTNLQSAFASIGDGLTDTEAANLYTAVQAYQTTLSRNV